MREMTASEASRNFSALLDAIEQGETIAVTRNGTRVATIGPSASTNGEAFAAILRRRRAERRIEDDSMERAYREMRALVSHEYDSDPWAE